MTLLGTAVSLGSFSPLHSSLPKHLTLLTTVHNHHGEKTTSIFFHHSASPMTTMDPNEIGYQKILGDCMKEYIHIG